ncbi:hypothetical protein [Chitinophaga rhizophila]|nr:hypothetical protein [Chitinophaga rhizophila]
MILLLVRVSAALPEAFPVLIPVEKQSLVNAMMHPDDLEQPLTP